MKYIIGEKWSIGHACLGISELNFCHFPQRTHISGIHFLFITTKLRSLAFGNYSILICLVKLLYNRWGGKVIELVANFNTYSCCYTSEHIHKFPSHRFILLAKFNNDDCSLFLNLLWMYFFFQNSIFQISCTD